MRVRFLRAMPSLTDVAFLLPAVFLFTRLDGARTLLSDGDTGWHIRAGEWMLAQGAVPRRDLFSFTRPDAPWLAWEWLSEMIMAWLYRLGGMAAVVLAAIGVLALTFALLYRLARARSSNALAAIVVTWLAAAGSSIHWLARPHLATLLFTVLFLAVLESGRTRPLLLLPVLTILWTNLHAGFLVGILLVSVYGAGEWISAALDPDPARWKRGRWYLATALACGAASLANPYGYRLHAHLWQYLAGSTYHYRYIVEFLSLSFRHPAAIYFEVMLALAMAAVFWHLTRRRYTLVLMLALWGHLALLAARNIPLFLVVAAAPVALAVSEWLECAARAAIAGWARRALAGLRDFCARIDALDRCARVPAAGLAGGALVALLFYLPSPPRAFCAEYTGAGWPQGALAALRADPAARVFTTDDWGDYLIYRLYPAVRVFVDGRSDFYGDVLEQTYRDVLDVRHDWQQKLDRYAVDTVLLPADAPLTGALKQSRRWRACYDDGTALVFRAARPEAEKVSAGVSLTRLLPPGKTDNPQSGAN